MILAGIVGQQDRETRLDGGPLAADQHPVVIVVVRIVGTREPVLGAVRCCGGVHLDELADGGDELAWRLIQPPALYSAQATKAYHARRRRMPAQTPLTYRQLLKAVEQMPQSKLDQFVGDVAALRASTRAPRLSHTESDLLTKINRGVPAELQSRYGALVAKRRAGGISQAEYDELLRLTEEVEDLDVQRVEYLAELARLRKMTVPALMKDLGIKTPAYA